MMNGKCAAMLSLILVIVGFGAPTRADEYTLDPVHSRIGFGIGHLGLSTVHGEFTNYTARITFREGDMSSLSAEATIAVKSLDTRVAARDQHVTGPDFFDADHFPEIRFLADQARKKNENWFLVGTLTMHGVSRPMELPVTVKGPIVDQRGNKRIGFHAEIVIDRQDYGVGSGKPVDKMVGDEVSIGIDAEATAANK